MHPYIGFIGHYAGRFSDQPQHCYFVPPASGTIIFVGAQGSDRDGMDTMVTLRMANGTHLSVSLDSVSVPDWGPVEWQTTYGKDSEPTMALAEGYKAIGAWEPVGCGMENGRINGGIEDMETVVLWRRPIYRKI